MFVDKRSQSLGDLVHRLLVGNLFPPIFTPFSNTFQWHPDPVLMVVYLRCGDALETDIVCQHGVVMGDNPGHFAILGLGSDLAANVADGADGVSGGCAHGDFLVGDARAAEGDAVS